MPSRSAVPTAMPIEIPPADKPAGRACCALPPTLRLAAEEADQLAGVFKALGHPVRLQMVDLLSRYGGQVCVCDLEGQFDLSQPTISHHLKILREAGLIASEQRGLWVYYYLRPATLSGLQSLVAALAPEEALLP